MYDPRAVANLILDAADRYGFEVSNLKLQKLLFFAYGRFLIEQKRPLLNGAFEAWQHGPVHPLVYQAFKANKGASIVDRAKQLDPVTRELKDLPLPSDPDVSIVVDRTVLEFGRMSANKLRSLTHTKGGPWDETIKQSQFKSNLGLRIRDEVISERFRSQLMVVQVDEEGEGPSENAPYS